MVSRLEGLQHTPQYPRLVNRLEGWQHQMDIVIAMQVQAARQEFYNHMLNTLARAASLYDVVYGDVWVCSGQSNMQFTVSNGFNATAEIAAADHYPQIRVFTAALRASSTPLIELAEVEQEWALASHTSIGGPNWGFFSATCWFFGRNVYEVCSRLELFELRTLCICGG